MDLEEIFRHRPILSRDQQATAPSPALEVDDEADRSDAQVAKVVSDVHHADDTYRTPQTYSAATTIDYTPRMEPPQDDASSINSTSRTRPRPRSFHQGSKIQPLRLPTVTAAQDPSHSLTQQDRHQSATPKTSASDPHPQVRLAAANATGADPELGNSTSRKNRARWKLCPWLFRCAQLKRCIALLAALVVVGPGFYLFITSVLQFGQHIVKRSTPTHLPVQLCLIHCLLSTSDRAADPACMGAYLDHPLGNLTHALDTLYSTYAAATPQEPADLTRLPISTANVLPLLVHLERPDSFRAIRQRLIVDWSYQPLRDFQHHRNQDITRALWRLYALERLSRDNDRSERTKGSEIETGFVLVGDEEETDEQ